MLDPLAAASLASSVISLISFFLYWKEDQRSPIVHFVKLHEQNVQKFDGRLKQFAQDHFTVQNGDMDNAAHDELHDLLHRYCEAITDFEQMNERSPVTSVIYRARASNTANQTGSLPGELVAMLTPKSSRMKAKTGRAFISFILYTLINFFIAISVGAALIVPMLIMVLDPSRNTSLITTCVFVFGFASALVIFNAIAYWIGSMQERSGNKSDMLSGSMLQIKDIIGATAAYAAVLVVFVGLTKSD